MAETDVKPCPFCGDRMESFAGYVTGAFAFSGGKFAVECDCGALGGFAPSMAEAVAAWNHRAALSGTREAGEPGGCTCGAPYGLRKHIHRDHADECPMSPLYAAPPAEVERGAVTDETVRLACPQCDFGIGLHEPGCGQLPAALASPTPAPPAVEAQGVERRCIKLGCGALELIGNPCTDWDCPQQTVLAEDHQRALASEKARADRLEAAFADASRQLGDTVALMQAAKADYFTAEAELAKLRKALDAAHFYIDASVTELGDMGISRDEALAIARALRPTTSEEGKAG